MKAEWAKTTLGDSENSEIKRVPHFDSCFTTDTAKTAAKYQQKEVHNTNKVYINI